MLIVARRRRDDGGGGGVWCSLYLRGIDVALFSPLLYVCVWEPKIFSFSEKIEKKYYFYISSNTEILNEEKQIQVRL